MRTLVALLVSISVLFACERDQVEPGEVKAVLRGYQDDTYNLCFGWLFEVGSDVLPTSEIPESFQQQRNVQVWLRYERDTISTRAKGFPQCNLIKVLSIRKRD